MSLESLKKTAQDALTTARSVAEKTAKTVGDAATDAVGSVRSVAPERFDSAVKTVTGTATSAVEAAGQTKLGQKIAEGAGVLAETAVSVGGRIARAAQAAGEAFVAPEPAKDEPRKTGKPTP
jgi:hypothetical protein